MYFLGSACAAPRAGLLMGAWVTYREFAAPVLIVKPPGPLAERARDMVLFDPEL